MRILEVGCGNGDFLQNIKAKVDCDVYGLELNEKAVYSAKKKGIEVHIE